MTEITDVKTSPFADIAKDGIIVLPWLDGMEPGGGYDSLAQIVKGNASGDGSDLKLEASTARSQTFTQDIRRIENTEQLNNSLSVSASVNGSYGLFSASASSTYQKKTEVNSYSLYFLISSFVRNSEQQIKKFVLDQNSLQLNADEFRVKYGDYFVQGVISGGTFYSLLQLATDSEETKEDITASAEASYSGGFSIGGKFSTEIGKAASHKGVNLSSTVSATGATASWNSGQKFDTVDDLLKLASEFPKGVHDGGAPMFAILKPYSLLQDAPKTGASIDSGAINAIRQTITQVYLQAKQILDSVNYALNNPKQFPEVKDLHTVQQEMTNVMQDVLRINKQLVTDPTKTDIELPKMPSLSLIPERLWGGTLKSIAPPKNQIPVVPSNLRFKIGVAQNLAWDLTDKQAATKVNSYLEQVESDITENLSNVWDFIKLLQSDMKALNNELTASAAQSLASNLADKRQTLAEALNIAISKQKAQYESFSNLNTDNQLDFLEKNLNPVLWTTTDPQYGGVKFWEELKTVTDLLTTITNSWTPKGKGSQFFKFQTGMWKQLEQSFHEAMMTLYVND